MKRCRPLLFLLLLVITACFSPISILGQSYTSRQRIGVGVQSHHPADYLNWYDFEAFNFGWYFTWAGAGSIPKPGNIDGVEFMPMFYGGSCSAKALDFIKNNPDSYPPGTTFFIGNELGKTEIPNMTTYAQNYHNCYHSLKDINRNYKVVLGALTSSGLIDSHLKVIRSEYKRLFKTDLKTDGYRINVYWEELDRNVLKMRDYMKSVGDQDKDLIITESCRPGKTKDENIVYLKEALNYVTKGGRSTNIGKPSDDYMLVQRFGWFLLNTGSGYLNCSLYDISMHAAAYPPLKTKKTSVGNAFINWMKANIPTLAPTKAPTTTPTPVLTPTAAITPTSTVVPTVVPTIKSTPTPTLKHTPVPSVFLTITPTPVSTCPKKGIGDANCDDKVNIMDFGIWKVEFIDFHNKITKDLWAADFDNDQKVAIYDFSIWKLNLGK